MHPADFAGAVAAELLKDPRLARAGVGLYLDDADNTITVTVKQAEMFLPFGIQRQPEDVEQPPAAALAKALADAFIERRDAHNQANAVSNLQSLGSALIGLGSAPPADEPAVGVI